MILSIIHLISYLIGIVLTSFVAKQIDYTKFLRIRSNKDVYLCYIIITIIGGYIIGEFMYNIATMFM